MEHVDLELPELLRDDLPEADRERIERHLAGCPSCRETWETISVLRDRPRSTRSDVPAGYFATLPSRILERRVGPPRRAWLRPVLGAVRPFIPVAAGALAIAWLFNVSSPVSELEERYAVPTTDAVEYLTTDLAVSSHELSAAVEPFLADRTLALAGEVTEETGIEDLEPQTVGEVVADLSDAEVDRLILKLSERVIL